MPGLNDKEKRILRFLESRKIVLPVNHIAKKTEMSWETAESYLEDLEADEYVIREEWDGKQKWGFNFKKYNQLKRKYK